MEEKARYEAMAEADQKRYAIEKAAYDAKNEKDSSETGEGGEEDDGGNKKPASNPTKASVEAKLPKSVTGESGARAFEQMSASAPVVLASTPARPVSFRCFRMTLYCFRK